MITTFSASQIELLRQQAAQVSAPPEDCPEGWSKSTVDPMEVLAIFKPLRIKRGFVLRAYQFREGGNGNAVVWALPADAEFPSPDQCPRLEGGFLDPPKPPAALGHFMDAVEGDGSPWSYLCASILARELAEFGAMWHGCDWSTHRVLDAAPWETGNARIDWPIVEPAKSDSEWRWQRSRPSQWEPHVRQSEKTVQVVFFTYSALGSQAVYRHTDTYQTGTYRFHPECVVIASGPSGFVF